MDEKDLKVEVPSELEKGTDIDIKENEVVSENIEEVKEVATENVEETSTSEEIKKERFHKFKTLEVDVVGVEMEYGRDELLEADRVLKYIHLKVTDFKLTDINGNVYTKDNYPNEQNKTFIPIIMTDKTINNRLIEDDKYLKWQDWTRYSSRQEQKMKLGGVIGEWHFNNLSPELAKLLYIGQWLHCGKNATFGLGKYQITNL